MILRDILVQIEMRDMMKVDAYHRPNYDKLEQTDTSGMEVPSKTDKIVDQNKDYFMPTTVNRDYWY